MRLSLFAVAALAAASQVSGVKVGKDETCVLAGDADAVAVYGNCNNDAGITLKCVNTTPTGTATLVCQTFDPCVPADCPTADAHTSCGFKTTTADDKTSECKCDATECAEKNNDEFSKLACAATEAGDGNKCVATLPDCTTTPCTADLQYCKFTANTADTTATCADYDCTAAPCGEKTENCVKDADFSKNGKCEAITCTPPCEADGTEVCVKGATAADNTCKKAACDADVVGDCSKVDAAVADCKIDPITADSYCECSATKKCGGTETKCGASDKCELNCLPINKVDNGKCAARTCKKDGKECSTFNGVCLAGATAEADDVCTVPKCATECKEPTPNCVFNSTDYTEAGVCTGTDDNSATRVGAFVAVFAAVIGAIVA